MLYDSLIGLAKIVPVILIALLNVAFLTWYERKILGRIQLRMGPTFAGPKGLLQPIADVMKLLCKEDTTPFKADRRLFVLAPFVAFVPAMALYLVIPISKGWVAADLDYGLLYMFGISTILPVALVLAGFSSHNKFSLMGGLRAAAQQISYEVPLLLAALSIVLLTGTLNLTSIVTAQKGMWFILLQPFAFVFFMMAGLAELNRIPFDMPEAESELVGGYMTEYSGIKYAIFFLVEYSNMFVMATLVTILFLGGWNGPFLPPAVWFFIKVYFLIFVIIWIRATLPRVRTDQLMNFAWKFLIPASVANLILTAVLLLYSKPFINFITELKL